MEELQKLMMQELHRQPPSNFPYTHSSFYSSLRSRYATPILCWESCAINKGGFFEIAFVVVIDTHLPRFEALAYVLPHFDELAHVVTRAVTFAKENFCRQIRRKDGKHTFLNENYVLNTKILFTKLGSTV